MLKKIMALVLVAVMTISLGACGNSAKTASGKDSDVIKIGVITPLTGERAQNGSYTKETAELFAEQINADGGVLGKKIEIVFEDDQSTDQGGANAYQKLVSRGEVSATVVSIFSSVVLALEPYAKQYQVPTFTGGSSMKIQTLNNEYLWQIRYNDELAGNTMGVAAVETLGIKKPAFIHESDSFGVGLSDATKKVMIEMGVKEEDIIDITYNKSEKNFAPYLAKIKEAGADGIIACSQQIEASLIMKQAQATGLDIPMIGSQAFCQQVAISNAGDAANGWYSVTDWSPTISEDPGKTWVEEYEKKFGHVPDFSSSSTWDALLCITEAMKLAESTDPKAINEKIAEIDGLVGVASTYKPDENRICSTTQFVTKIEDQQANIINSISR